MLIILHTGCCSPGQTSYKTNHVTPTVEFFVANQSGATGIRGPLDQKDRNASFNTKIPIDVFSRQYRFQQWYSVLSLKQHEIRPNLQIMGNHLVAKFLRQIPITARQLGTIAINVVLGLVINLCVVKTDYETAFNLLSGSASSFPNSSQSLPNNSTGCCVRSEPFPQFMESTEQYLSQPQHIRSGCAGCIGNFLAISHFPIRQLINATYQTDMF
jgi:hypothetical protein